MQGSRVKAQRVSKQVTKHLARTNSLALGQPLAALVGEPLTAEEEAKSQHAKQVAQTFNKLVGVKRAHSALLGKREGLLVPSPAGPVPMMNPDSLEVCDLNSSQDENEEQLAVF